MYRQGTTRPQNTIDATGLRHLARSCSFLLFLHFCPVDLQEGKRHFIEQWGNMAVQWGANKAMGQIHAFLLLESEPACMEDIMAALNMSRGNVSINVRELAEWGIVHKRSFAGERRDFFEPERNMHRVALAIAKERKKRELDPLQDLIRDMSALKGHARNKELLHIRQTMDELKKMADKADLMLAALMVLDSTQWVGWMKKRGK